ncbi:hypothetical protein AB0I54_43395 [Streptomyces sp. NPDC050625]|uniref:hypothetical protein n=1 Tax=Streptomyces sp. NPDC050625 TaxID=3154629 RepID=UPI0034330166
MFEHRFAAAVIDGGVVDVSVAWHALLSPELRAVLDADELDRFNEAMDLLPANARRIFTWRAKAYGRPSLYDIYREILRTTCSAAQGTRPLHSSRGSRRPVPADAPAHALTVLPLADRSASQMQSPRSLRAADANEELRLGS